MHVSAIPQSDLTSNNVFSSCTKKIEAQFHEFIPKLHCTCQQSWDRFKASFFGESRENQFLKTLTKMETIDWDSHKEEIAEILLKASPYGRKGHFLKILLKRCDIENLKGILNLTFEKIFDSSQFNFERILKFLDQKDAASASCSKELMEEIQEIAESLPDIEANKTNKVESEIRKTFKVALNFFPNLMDTMLKAFNLIEAGKGPETMWDFAAMMEIYFKVFMIPHSIFLVVGAVVAVPWQVFLITGVLVLAAVVGVCLYLKYRPCPSKLPRARNLTEEAELGKLEPVIGREKEIHQMGTFLGKKEDGILTNLLLVGEPGVGKTELVKGVAQKYKEKTIFALNAPELASGYTPVGDKLRLLFLDIKGHEDKVVFFIDELGEAIKKNSMANIGGFLKPFLGPDGVQVIAAVTSEEFKEHIFKVVEIPTH